MVKENLPEVISPSDVAVVDNSPMATYSLLLAQKADLSQFEKMLEIQEKWERREAEKAFYKAMAAFKKNPPKIFKDRHVDYTTNAGRTQYDHASLANIVEKICTELSKHGLSADWDQKQADNQLTITCYLTHELGFSKQTSMTAPPDTSGGKNGIQGLGSTNSYLQRYTLLALTGLATHDQDNDGQTAELQYIDKNQVGQIVDMVNSIEKYKIESFLSWARIETVELMLLQDFEKSMNALKDKAKAAKK